MRCRWCNIRIVQCTCGLPRPHWVSEYGDIERFRRATWCAGLMQQHQPEEDEAKRDHT